MGLKKFKLNLPGLNELMKSPEIQSILQEKGQQVENNAQSMCPDGKYKTRVVSGRWIAAAWVSPDNYAAYRDNLENNTLIKARDMSKG